jgi:phytoene synthase
MSEDQTAAAFCAELVRSQDFDRYASTLFVDAERRRALLALYAFNVEIVRVRDQVSQPLPGEIRMQWWTDMLAGAGHGGDEGNPVVSELLLAIQNHALPTEKLSRLIEAHIFDLYDDPMPDLAALEAYCVDTSSALFALAARILGPSAEPVDHLARHAGFAQGIARAIADLPLDASRRQLFMPQSLLGRHGCDVEELFAGRETPALRAALEELIAEARGHLKTAYDLLPGMPPETRLAFLSLPLIDRDLQAFARPVSNPFAPDVRSRLRTLWTLWRASRSRVFS